MLFAAAQYRRARLVLPLLAVVPLMLSTRSLSGYLFFLLVPALVGATTLPRLTVTSRTPSAWVRRWLRGGVAATVAAAAVTGFVLSQTSPLAVAVVSGKVTGIRWESVTVVVTNHSAHSVAPNFFAARNEVEEFTLTRVDGPASLAAGSTATYRLETLPGDDQLRRGDAVRIVVLSDQPEAISNSDVYQIGSSGLAG
jgi:hypothetical protein